MFSKTFLRALPLCLALFSPTSLAAAIRSESSSSNKTESRLAYQFIDVFTKTGYATGDSAAVVHIPHGATDLTEEQKQLIARDFNLGETVIMHDNPEGTAPDVPVNIDIFTTGQEVTWTGNPVIAASYYLLSSNKHAKNITLVTEAGNVPAYLDDTGSVRLQVPINFTIHNPISLEKLKEAQPLNSSDYVGGINGQDPVVSVVDQVTFVLMELNSVEALSSLIPPEVTITAQGVDGLIGLYAFVQTEDGTVRTRAFVGVTEFAAAGSGAATLGGYLEPVKGPGRWTIEILQGVEMGRPSSIEVPVEVGSDGVVSKIELVGGAIVEMDGTLRPPALS